ncbi:MAG: PadR family transcriptional regulator [Actinobacteria bacterium]|nr:PadR family transcriptional regulator [Actinomycetota bacterium]
MALRHALLAALSHGPASGYDLSKLFESGMQEFWRASPQQIYSELHKLNERGLIAGKLERDSNRPQKRVYALTGEGEHELFEFTRSAPRRPVVRDEMLVKLYAADHSDIESLIESLTARAQDGFTRVEQLRVLVRLMRREMTHEEYLRRGGPVGPYLTCLWGILWESDNARICQWLAAVMRVRADDGEGELPADPMKFD